MRPPWSGCSRHPAGRCGRSRSRPSIPARPRRSPGSSTRASRSPSATPARTSRRHSRRSAPERSILTHAFNGMRGIHHRAPGPVVAAMHADHVTLEVINDGVHVHPDVVRLAFAGAHGRVALVTDAMAAAGAADGAYRLGLARGDRRGRHRAAARGRLDRGIHAHPGRRPAPGRASTAASRSTRPSAPSRSLPPRRSDARTTSDDSTRAIAADAVLLTPDLDVEAVWGAGRAARLTPPAFDGARSASTVRGPEACSPSPPSPRPFDVPPRPPDAAPHAGVEPAPPRIRVLRDGGDPAPGRAFTRRDGAPADL